MVSPTLSANEICASFPGFYATCAATDWTGVYQIGQGSTIGIGGSSFGVPQPDPDGSQALILQTGLNFSGPDGHTSTATQSISIGATGIYELTFYLSRRSNGFDGPQTLSVLLDNVTISGGTYAILPNLWNQETLDFSVSSGTHSVTFEDSPLMDSADAAAFVDDVSLQLQPTPEPASLTLFALAVIILASKKTSSCVSSRYPVSG